MKLLLTAAAVVVLSSMGATRASAQGGSLTPTGAPEPTMRSLQELWDKMEALQRQLTTVANKVGVLSIEMVTVGNAGNEADITGDPNPSGAVGYEYQIGKYEVTNEQYAKFLNAVAEEDANALYNSQMGSDARGGITQSGASPNFTYAVKANMGNKPVMYVSWYDAARFCNWLHNGQPSGLQVSSTTEDGAYTLTGTNSVAAGTDPTHGANGRNAGALFHLPSENEWYKAAYHFLGAGGDSYWDYPTQSDSVPTQATADAVGNIDNDTANIANYFQGADWNGQDGNVTTVGSGGAGSQSFYGSADMGGNLSEWTEEPDGSNHITRGASWANTSPSMAATFRASSGGHSNQGGFRVAAPR